MVQIVTSQSYCNSEYDACIPLTSIEQLVCTDCLHFNLDSRLVSYVKFKDESFLALIIFTSRVRTKLIRRYFKKGQFLTSFPLKSSLLVEHIYSMNNSCPHSRSHSQKASRICQIFNIPKGLSYYIRFQLSQYKNIYFSVC